MILKIRIRKTETKVATSRIIIVLAAETIKYEEREIFKCEATKIYVNNGTNRDFNIKIS